jgi:A/G-specific adenine glycosylase
MRKPKTRNSKPETSGVPAPRLIVPALLRWFAEHARDLPWRRTRDPYAIWVSEIMLQQTQVTTVIPYWERWMRELPTIQSLASAKPGKIHKLWEGLGYYTRVRNMQKAAQQIVGRRRGDEPQTRQKAFAFPSPLRKGRGIKGEGRDVAPVIRTDEPSHRVTAQPLTPTLSPSDGERESRRTAHVVACQFPENFDAILALPGIGRYTAGAIASIAFNQPAPILDGNVIRVLTRLHGIAGDPHEKKSNARLCQLAADLVLHASRITNQDVKPETPPPCSALNQSLMELGALICTPRSPNCAACPIAQHCVALRENRVEKLPRPKQRATATARRFLAFIIERNGRFLAQQRPDGEVNAHLWEFPNGEALAKDAATDIAERLFGVKPAAIEQLCVIKHSITRYRLSTEAYCLTVNGTRTIRSAPTPRAWQTLAQLRKLPFTAAHRRIVTQLGKSLAAT